LPPRVQEGIDPVLLGELIQGPLQVGHRKFLPTHFAHSCEFLFIISARLCNVKRWFGVSLFSTSFRPADPEKTVSKCCGKRIETGKPYVSILRKRRAGTHTVYPDPYGRFLRRVHRLSGRADGYAVN